MGIGERLRRQGGFLAEDLDVFAPRIEIYGDRRVLVENHDGILEYGREVMRIKCGRLIVKISGEELELSNVSLTALAVTGRVIGVELL